MPLTPEQEAKIQSKEASMPEALKRDASTDYREGYFFVTLNTRGEAPILSIVKGKVGGVGPDAPHCEYTDLGKRVKEVITSIPTFHSSVKVIDSEVMPEHIHMLLYLHADGNVHLGKIISGFMGGCTHAYWDVLGIDWRKNHPTQSADALKSIQEGKGPLKNERQDRDRDHTRSFRGPALFVHGYNDTEPVTPEEVQKKIAYIHQQAERRLIKGQNYDCFRIHRNQHSKNWTPECIANAIKADRFFSANQQKFEDAKTKVWARLNDGLDYLGNRAIMAAPRKLPLICHRSDANRFEEQKTAVIEAARSGAVIVSAFISPKEREIKEQLMCEMLPLIEVMDNGFSERYKPYGKAFYACAEMRMVQITPWKYEYQKDAAVSREQCLVMNELARVISGEKDNWWKLE